jgi:hypothetical protein
MVSIKNLGRKEAKLPPPFSLGSIEIGVDELSCEYEVLRAMVMTLLASYYRAQPGDTRSEKALAALPAEHRDMASAQLGRIIEATRKLARQAERGQPAPAKKTH